MALKATIFKADLQIADIDRNLYADHSVTIARHPSETDERMMIRMLAFALNVPADDHAGALVFAKSLSDTDEPDLWHKDLTGRIVHWIDVGQPDEKRLQKIAPRADRVTVYSYAHSTPVWWKAVAPKLGRARNITVWQVASDDSHELAAFAERTMQLQITVQDGAVWIHTPSRSLEVHLQRLTPAPD
jgi:uncharacterized protein YaeQ